MWIGNLCNLSWQNQENVVLTTSTSASEATIGSANSSSKDHPKLLEKFIADKLKSHILIKTSGSTGNSKWVALSKKAILTSADSVNKHLKITESDKWFLSLPTTHIGGLSILARAYLSQNPVDYFHYKWSPQVFVEHLTKAHSSLTSLVPTQVHDLVVKGLSSPKSLRCVLVGGGGLLESLYCRGRELGWPLLPSYGLTECASQVATASLHSLEKLEFPALEILPHVCVKVLENNQISLKSESLFTGYIEQNNNGFEWIPHKEESFLTDDLGEIQSLKNDSSLHLKILGRVGHSKKIKGRLVNGFILNQEFQSRYGNEWGEILIFPDSRQEHSVVLVSESREIKKTLVVVEQFNSSSSNGERISKVYFVNKIPRTELGKSQQLFSKIFGTD